MKLVRSGLVLWFAVVFAGQVVAQSAAPRAVLDRWIEVMNAGDATATEQYVDTAFAESFYEIVPRDQIVQVHRQLHGVAPFALVQVEMETTNHMTALLSGASDSYWRIQLTVEGDPPLIAGILVQPAEAPGTADEFEWESLDELAGGLSDEFGLPGVAIAVAPLGAEPRVGVAGVRAAGGDAAVEPGDAFHVGSITKSINSTMLARLVEDGEFDWQDTLGELLPERAAGTPYADVTLARLVRHRGGVQQHMTFGDAEMSRLNGLPGTPTDQRAAYTAEVLQLEPLDRNFHYSNAGTSVAGYVAERATGRDWGELVIAEVFEPLGLQTCGIGWPTESDPDAPVGHAGPRDGRRPQNPDFRLGAFMEPAGDVHCSVGDLARYGQAHLAGLTGQDGFLSADSIAELHRVSEPAAPYAAGWGVDPETGQHRHNGSAGTFFGYLVIDPAAEVVIAFLANAGLPEGQQAAVKAVEQILARQE